MNTADKVAIIVAAATIAQAFFAWWGGKIQDRAAEAEAARRRREWDSIETRRTHELEEAQDAAYMQMWAEHFRLESLADQWESLALEETSLLGILDPAIVLPANASELVRLASVLGREAGFLCAVAITHANDTSLEIAQFNAEMQRFRAEFGNATIGGVVDIARRSPHQFEPQRARLRRSVKELSLLYWDVVIHSPRNEVQRLLTFNDRMSSSLGKAAVAAIAASSASALPQGEGRADAFARNE